MPTLPQGAQPEQTSGASGYFTVLGDIIKRVQAKLEDPEGTYITDNYVIGFAQDVYEMLYNKLRVSGYEFSDIVVPLPGVPAGTPDLSQYMAQGGPLAMLVRARMIEWKLPGMTENNYRMSDGPLDNLRDIQPGLPQLDCWTYMRRNIQLSNFSTALDLRVTGEFLFDPLVEVGSPIEMDITLNRTLSCYLAAEVAKARGNPTWVTQYTKDGDDSFDDLFIALVRSDQGKTRRVARMARKNVRVNSVNISH